MFQIESIRNRNDKNESPSEASLNYDKDHASKSSETFQNQSSVESGGKNRPFGKFVMKNSIEINTSKDGVNVGRSYYLKVREFFDFSLSLE